MSEVPLYVLGYCRLQGIGMMHFRVPKSFRVGCPHFVRAHNLSYLYSRDENMREEGVQLAVVPSAMPLRSGFRVQGSGIRVQCSGFRVQCPGFRVQGSGFRVQGSGFRVQGSGFRVRV